MITFSQVPQAQNRSEDYCVSVNGTAVPVYTCRISAVPFNTVWPGHQRPLDQAEEVCYINLVGDGEANLQITPKTKGTEGRIMLKPYSKNICPTVREGKICFTLREYRGYVLEIGDYHGLLYVFYNPPFFCEDPRTVTHYFGPGVHTPGKVELHSDESVYVDKDALIYGCFFAKNAKNIRIFGNGILNDRDEIRPAAIADMVGNLRFYDCKNVCVEGVGLTDSAEWCFSLFHCFDVTARNIHIFGQWRYNTDGIDVVNCQRVSVTDSFIHSFDDTLAVKGIDHYSYESNRDLRFEGCVLWCDWGKTCEIGLECAAKECTDIVFRDCDLLRAGDTACDIQNGHWAEVHHVIFENLRVELEDFYTLPVYQRNQNHKYDGDTGTEIPRIFSVHNRQFSEVYPGFREGEHGIPPKDENFASAHHITVKDIALICTKDYEDRFGKECGKIRLLNFLPTTKFHHLSVQNVTLNGRPLSPAEFTVQAEGVSHDILQLS